MNLELKAAIVRLFGSQSNFAVIVKTDEPSVSRVVHGRKRLTGEERARWAALLQGKPGVLFKDCGR